MNTSHGAHDMKRKRIGVLTAGGDTPALNATIYGLVEEVNRCETEVVGLLRGYARLVGNKVPTVVMNPLFSTIPELDPCWGGTILGSSRVYVAPRIRSDGQGAGQSKTTGAVWTDLYRRRRHDQWDAATN